MLNKVVPIDKKLALSTQFSTGANMSNYSPEIKQGKFRNDENSMDEMLEFKLDKITAERLQ